MLCGLATARRYWLAMQEGSATTQHSARPRLLPFRKHPHHCLERLPRPLLGGMRLEDFRRLLLPQHSGRQPQRLARLQLHSASPVLRRHLASMRRQQLPSAQLRHRPSLSAALLPREQQVRLCSAKARPPLGLAPTQARLLVEAVRADLLVSTVSGAAPHGAVISALCCLQAYSVQTSLRSGQLRQHSEQEVHHLQQARHPCLARRHSNQLAALLASATSLPGVGHRHHPCLILPPPAKARPL